MPITDINEIHPSVYVVLGIDANEHDQVLSVCVSFQRATRFLTEMRVGEQFYDLWIEKHEVI